MIKKLLFFVSILFCFGANTVLADGLNVDIVCPATVKAGSALVVTYNVENSCCNSQNPACTIKVSKALATLGGNANSTFGGMGIYGPFSRNVSATVPPCYAGPGPAPLTIISAVPAGLAGKVAMVNVMFTSYNYKNDFGGGMCYVNVLQ